MPPVNHAVLTSAGIIAVSVAVAAAIAVYESPELRRMADDLRRRIAIALHSLGDNVDPNREPRFNRPEDAEGFMESRRVVGGADTIDSDDETRRLQRNELMYWNAVREQKEQERREAEQAAWAEKSSKRSSTFDDFMQPDQSAERGTYVFNTGANVRSEDEGLLRRRGVDGVRGLNASLYANPFGDEHGITDDEHPGLEPDLKLLSPGHDEIMSDDIYNATPQHALSPVSRTLTPQPVPEVLFDMEDNLDRNNTSTPVSTDSLPAPPAHPLLERELADDEFMTAGQDDRQDAYASIQAWAQGSNPSFYSPLPVSPAAPLSEPEIISDGALTPTDTLSLAGSGEDIANYAASSRAGDYDVLSEDEGISTPRSNWSEVASVVSEADAAVHAY